MLKIRLQRVGRKHVPAFRVVLTDSRNSTKSGKFKEVLGTYNLATDEKRVDTERVKHWISKGAQPSGTVHNFLVSEHVISGKKQNVLPKRRPIIKEEKGEAKETSPKSEAAGETPAEPPQETTKSETQTAPAKSPASVDANEA